MGIAAVKIRIMPSSPGANLKKIGEEAKKLVEKCGGKNPSVSEEPIAFGLKAVILFFAWPEEKELEVLEKSLEKVREVNSVQVIDMRRAFGS
jgi:elongation factor 1-beta